MSSQYEEFSESDEEEEECRVCRGPAEEGRPLFKPCKCSGSIGLTHQDCLTSWLEVTRGDGRCELCSTRFRFAPQYADGTPDRLPPREVGFRILRRLGAKWLPRGLRALLAASLWLVVLPLSTSYIYHGWMHRPSAITSRWSWDLVKRDTVGGAVIAIIIIVSFLSLMSFAEFLRFQWGGVQGRGGGARERRGNNNRANNNRGGPIEGEIDNIIVHHDELGPLEPFLNHSRTVDEDNVDNEDSIADSSGSEAEVGGNPREEDENPNDADNVLGINEVQIPMDHHGAGVEGQVADNLPPTVFEHEEDELEAFMRAQEEEGEENGRPELDPVPGPGGNNDGMPELNQNLPAGNVPNLRPRDDARFEPQFEPLQPAFAEDDAQDDGAEVEINVALDELLGFRGPLLALVRNLLWLLVFNTAYLGVFAFAPSKFGGSFYAIIARLMTFHPTTDSMPDSTTGFGKVWGGFIASMHELDKKSNENNLIYQPVQVAKMGLGYVLFSIVIFLMKAVVTFVTRMRDPTAVRWGVRENERNRGRAQRDDFRDDVPLLVGRDREEVDLDDDNQPIGKRFLGFLECAGAIAKVVILLFIKMLLLPLMLGIWLDMATLSLFEKTWNERLDYAGTDLFGSVFLHWVTGITFMLLVTVSVLQLREVAHPDILARVIRPQEPQPDLLGNLLQESGTTHTKRVLLSLGIYAALLAIHIWLPARLLLLYDMGKYLPLFQPKFWHILMPQIQVPVELFIFHLCMLGVLEKYKNNIGEMQHHWLLFMGNHLRITNQILPREVEQFSLVGSLPVFVDDALPSQMETMSSNNRDHESSAESPNEGIYPLWNDLLSETVAAKREEIIRSSIHRMDRPGSPRYKIGTTRRDGKRLLSSHAYIRLPSTTSLGKPVVKTSNDAASNLIPTSIGPYRLKQGVTPGLPRVSTIEIWHEEVGKPIPRPPEGWDDLGVGGAERHGRWAWGEEQLSDIENSVAVRTPFFNDPTANSWITAYTLIQLVAKMIFLLLVSWFAISVVLVVAINAPLYTGHFALFLLRTPDECVHDPLAFAIGVLLLFPILGGIVKLFAASKNGIKGVLSLLLNWVKSFKPHQTHQKAKTLSSFFVLWFIVCPSLLGFLHSSFFIGIRQSSDWNGYADILLINLGTGTLLLNSWAAMCYFQMFTKKFWADVVAGDGQGNGNNENQDNGLIGARQGGMDNPGRNPDGENDAQDNYANELGKIVWQGEGGAIAHALESVKDFALRWEWDKVDKQSLLQDCALPVAKHLAISCAVPIAAMSISLVVPLAKVRPNAIFRTFAIASIVVDSINSSKHSLQSWFEAAHTIARDDRYLIGEILLNYSPQQSST